MDIEMDFNNKLSYFSNLINTKLDSYFAGNNSPEKTIYNAMKYSITAGGKRLRPVLALSVCEMLEGDIESVLPFACAVEFIHTYSLIHDDLPAMDNDDYRRGRLTNHKVFGEAVAILAGDALLNYAFEIMLKDMTSKEHGDIELKSKVRAMQFIADASGPKGMIAGQIVDMESEGQEITPDLLNYMHRGKTGALIKAPVLAAAVICKADSEKMQLLEAFAENIGLAFQIKDDILDVEGDFEKMGKKSGSDISKNKSTYVSVYGMEKSRQMLEEITDKAVNSLNSFGNKAEFLKNLALFLVQREH